MISSSTTRLQSRNARGSAAVELGISALVMIGLVAFGLNICLAMIGYTINDRACRDAARAAAQGASLGEATQRANRIVRTYERSSALFRSLRVDGVTYNDFSGNPPAGVSPFVSVTTAARSDIPCPVNLFGNNLFGSSMQFRKTYTFPIIKVRVATGPAAGT